MKPTTDYDDKMRIHAATVAYRQGRLSRRDLLKYLGAGGRRPRVGALLRAAGDGEPGGGEPASGFAGAGRRDQRS